MLMEKISDTEKCFMTDFISYCAFESNPENENRVGIETILKPWEEAKSQYLAKMFGRELILQKPIFYEANSDEITAEIEHNIFDYHSKGWEFVNSIYDLIAQNYSGYRKIKDLIYDDFLATNIYDGADFDILLPNGKNYKVRNGCKVSRVLGKLAAAFNLRGYEDFRIAHSMILNQKTLKGNLCISIHPLDYMTMSDNDCDWSSCMSWTEEGEYRRGTVEMMNSKSVVVAYLTAKEPYQWNEYEWSNKKWRQLFIVTPDVICGIKGYPYCNEGIEKIVADWLRELAPWEYSDEYISMYPGTKNLLPNGNNVHVSFHTNAMYNDFGCTSHHAYFGVNVSSDIRHTYSGYTECMCCGSYSSNSDDYDNEESLICENCEKTHRCYDCGERHEESEMHNIDGVWLCDYCADSAACYCELTEEQHLNSNLVDVSLTKPDGAIMTDVRITIYSGFVDDPEFQELYKDIYKRYFKAPIECFHRLWREDIYYINCEDCTPEGLYKLFGFNSIEEVEDYDAYLISKDED